MFTFFVLFLIVLFAPVAIAKAVTVARTYTIRVRCYRRNGVHSLIRAAKRNAIVRHYGNV